MVDRHDIFFGPGRSTFWIPTIWTTIGSTFAIGGLISITAGVGEKLKLANLTESAKIASLFLYIFSYVFCKPSLGLSTKIISLKFLPVSLALCFATGGTYHGVSRLLDKSKYTSHWSPMTRSVVAGPVTCLLMHIVLSVPISIGFFHGSSSNKDPPAAEMLQTAARFRAFTKRARSGVAEVLLIFAFSLFPIGAISFPGSVIVGYRVGKNRENFEITS